MADAEAPLLQSHPEPTPQQAEDQARRDGTRRRCALFLGSALLAAVLIALVALFLPRWSWGIAPHGDTPSGNGDDDQPESFPRHDSRGDDGGYDDDDDDDARPLAVARPSDGDTVRFLAIGDWGREGDWQAGNKEEEEGAQRQLTLVPVLDRAARDGTAQCIVSTGDNFYDKGLSSPGDRNFDDSFMNAYDAKAYPGLNLPWHIILGNHDYEGNPSAQVGPALTARDGRWRLPGLDGVVRLESPSKAASVDLFLVDTTPFVGSYRQDSDPGGNPYKTAGKHDTRIYDWTALGCQHVVTTDAGRDCFEHALDARLEKLSARLAASDATWKIVVGHHPIRSVGHHGDTAELVDRLDPVLRKHGVRIYINGHDHELSHIVQGREPAPSAQPLAGAADDDYEIHYVTSGAGSKLTHKGKDSPYSRYRAEQNGFVAVAASRDDLVVEFVTDSGVDYSFSVPREPGAAARRA